MTATRAATVDVLIVGAGPTGLTLSVELARRGVRHLLMERAETVRHGSRGKGIQPRSLEVFDDLGLLAPLRDSGVHGLPLRIHPGNRAPVDVPTAWPDRAADGAPYPDLLIVPQWRTEELLRDRLRELGGEVCHGYELTGLAQDDERVTADFRHAGGEVTVHARYLVGCDGGRSTVRRLLGVPMLGRTEDAVHYLLGDLRIRGLDPTRAHAWFTTDGGYLAVSPLPGTSDWQIQASTVPREDGHTETPGLDRFRELFSARTGLTDVTLSAVSWASRYRFNARAASRMRAGRTFLAGDAAHVHSPAGGLGLNTGVQDAYNLGWKLALALDREDCLPLLETYEAERLPIAHSVLRTSSSLWQAMFSGSALRRLLRDQVIFRLLQLPQLGKHQLARTSQLDVSYRRSPLSRSHGPVPGRGPQAGDRAPDAAGVDARRHPVRLFDLFRGVHTTVLAFGREAGPAAERLAAGPLARAHTIVSGAARAPGENSIPSAFRLYHAKPGDLCVVRPDGHLALRARPTAGKPLTGAPHWLSPRRHPG